MTEPEHWRGKTPAEYKRQLQREAREWLDREFPEQRRKPPTSKRATVSLSSLNDDKLLALPDFYEPDDTERAIREEQAVAMAVEMLSDDIREVVELYFYSRMSLRQIARQMGCSHATVQRRIRDGLDEMRELLQAAEKSWLHGEDDSLPDSGEDMPERIRAKVSYAILQAKTLRDARERRAA